MKHTNIRHTFIKYVSLNIIGMIGLSCYILADTFFVARGIGANGLTALNLAIPIYSFIHGIGLMIGMGGATRFAISKREQVFTQATGYAMLAACLFVAVGLFFSTQLATMLGANADTLQNTSIYLKTILCFAPMFLLNNVLICFVRNDGNPKLSMAAMLIGSLSNIVLDYLFIFPCNMGMFGAAFATGIAPVISLIILSAHFIKKQNTFRLRTQKLQIKALWDITSLGLSALIIELSSGIVMIVFNSIILSIAGNTGVAAYGIIANIALVVISVFTGISQGVQPIISLCYSAQNHGDIQKVLKYGAITTISFAILVYGVFAAFAHPVVAAFNKDANMQLAEIATMGLRIYFTCFAFAGINILLATYYSSVEKPKNAFTISVLRGFVIIIPTAFLLSGLFGLTGVWITMPVTELIVFLFSAGVLARKK
ncbi:MAG: MATE family efflux transporter [Angelakisella sp.]